VCENVCVCVCKSGIYFIFLMCIKVSKNNFPPTSVHNSQRIKHNFMLDSLLDKLKQILLAQDMAILRHSTIYMQQLKLPRRSSIYKLKFTKVIIQSGIILTTLENCIAIFARSVTQLWLRYTLVSVNSKFHGNLVCSVLRTWQQTGKSHIYIFHS